MSFHQTIVHGHLGRDPELRFTKDGDPVASFSVAVSEAYKNKAGEKVENTEWYSCVAFGRTAEVAGEYLHKGDAAIVIGKMKTEKWTDKEGVEKSRAVLRVDRLDLVGKPTSSRASGDQAGSKPERPTRSPAQTPRPSGGSGFDDLDDDIPF
jgi:single-strand DNA-binding protein